MEVTVLADEGNLWDAVVLCGVAALRHFRRPAVVRAGEEQGEGTGKIKRKKKNNNGEMEFPFRSGVRVAPERDPVGFVMHHVPLCVSVGVTPGEGLLVDPTNREMAAVVVAVIRVLVNPHGELCGVSKVGGVAVSRAVLERAIALAKRKCRGWVRYVQERLDADEKKRTRTFRKQFQWVQPRLGVGKGKDAQDPVPAANAESKEMAGVDEEENLICIDEDTGMEEGAPTEDAE